MDPFENFANTPSNRFLGMRLVSRSAERSEIELPMREEFAQKEGVVHGRLLSTLADSSAVYLIGPDLGPDRAMTGIEFKMNFFAPGDPTGPALHAVAKPLRIGRTIAVCESEVHQGDRRLAKGTFTYMLRERTKRPS